MRKIITISYHVIRWLILPLLTYMVIEALSLPRDFFYWLSFDQIFVPATFFNTLIIIFMMLIIYALTARFRVSFLLVSGFWFIVALVSYLKIVVRAQPLFLSDFSLVGDVLALDPTYFSLRSVTWPWREILIWLVAVIGFFIAGHFVKKLNHYDVAHLYTSVGKKTNTFSRVSLGAIGTISLTILIIGMRLHELPFYTNLMELYRHQGLAMSLIYSAYVGQIKKPTPRFSVPQLQAILDEKNASDSAQPSASPSTTISPNIIVIMNESFFDLGGYNSKLSTENLLPFYHRFRREGVSGEVISPVFAGNTSVAEFEFLTGHSAHFLPETLQPYVYFVKKNTLALPHLLSERGYQSLAYHPFNHDYWNRNLVYPHFGFRDFIAEPTPFVDEDTSDTDIYFPRGHEPNTFFMPDITAMRKIVQDLVNEKSSTPQFKFLVTIQNHGPYNSESIHSDETRAEVLPLLEPFNFSDEQDYYLSNYLLNLQGADQSLELLYNYLNSDTAAPTVVIFFGDHQPGLEDNEEVYRTLGMTTAGGDIPDTAQTPFFIWSNYFNAKEVGESLNNFDPDNLYLHDLSPLLFSLLNWPAPDYWQLSQAKNVPAWQSAQYNILFENSSQFDGKGNLVF